MTEEQAIILAQKYAATWSVPWGNVTKIEHQRAWWLLFQIEEYSISFDAEFGVGEVKVNTRYAAIERFEFYPNDLDHFMVPLWAAYPKNDSVTMAWRDGPGQDYKIRWHYWYREMSDTKRAEYKRRFPPPDHEWGGWTGFYESTADVRGDPKSITDNIFGRVP